MHKHYTESGTTCQGCKVAAITPTTELWHLLFACGLVHQYFGLFVFAARQQANIGRYCKGSSGPIQGRIKLLCVECITATYFFWLFRYCRQLQQSIIHKLRRHGFTACPILAPCFITALRANVLRESDLGLVASQFCLQVVHVCRQCSLLLPLFCQLLAEQGHMLAGLDLLLLGLLQCC